jgi:predicted ATPase
VITFRSNFSPPWRSEGHVTTLTLNRLTRSQSAALVAAVAEHRAMPVEVVDGIVARSDGVPLFVEELTKSLLEAQALDTEAGHQHRPMLAIPATVQDALTARLDRLAAVKEMAQIAATIGREFSYELMAAVTGLAEGDLQNVLDRLVQSGLIFRRGAPPNASFVFKHALVQDAAYQSLLKRKRQEIHGAIAKTLEERFQATADIEPELVAHHLTEAGLPERAVEHWLRAGRRAAERSANREAVGHLTKGLAILSSTPARSERARQELALQLALGAPLQALKGQAAPETAEVFRRARRLCGQLGETRQLSAILHGLHAFHIVRGELQPALEFAEACDKIARSQDDSALRAGAHFVLGCVAFHRATLTSARDHFERAVQLYDPSPNAPRVLPAGIDLGVFGKSYLSHVAWYLGDPDRAVAWGEAAAADAAERSHVFSRAVAAAYAAMLMQFVGDARGAMRQADRAIAVCAEHKFAYYLAWATLIKGWALAKEGSENEGIAGMREGLAALRATGAGLRQCYYLGILAETLGEAGGRDEALDLIATAHEVAAEHGEQFYSAELCRIEGTLSGRGAEKEKSEALLKRAIELARSQKARALELRSAIELARLWCDRGRTREACDLLDPIYDSYAEGFDLPDLRNAKVLLDALSRP